MQRSFRPAYTKRLVLAPLAFAAIASTTLAQVFDDPRIHPITKIANSSDINLPHNASQQFLDGQSTAEATPEASNSPSLGGQIGSRPKLTCNWRGLRSDPGESGVTLDVSSTQFYQGVATGGLKPSFQYGGRNDYFVKLDSEKLRMWEGGEVTLHGETRYGESVNSSAGTLLSPNLMLAVPQANGSVSALTGVTFTQSLSDEILLFGGKLNTLEDYAQPLTGANNLNGFQNTAMLYNPVYARTIPYSTLGAGFSLIREEETLFSACVYDTNDSTTVSGFSTFFNNGATLYSEFFLPTTVFDLPGHHGIGGAYSSGKYTSLTPSAYLDPIEGFVIATPLNAGSWCVAYNFDQALYVSSDDPKQMWGVFGNFGLADKNPSPVRWFASTGISGASQIAGRSASFGVAYFYLGVSDPLKELAPVQLPLRDEHGAELYYNMAITPWCQITPDLQAITPFPQKAEATLLLGLRANIDF